MVHRGRQPRGSGAGCRWKPLSELRLGLRGPAHRTGAGLRLQGDGRETQRTPRPTMRAHKADNYTLAGSSLLGRPQTRAQLTLKSVRARPTKEERTPIRWRDKG